MDQDSREQYQHFLLHSNVATDLYEFRDNGGLRMVSLVDRLGDGLSSVYTFFDPGVAGMSYGTYNVLWQIERCKALGIALPVPRLLHRRKPEDGLQGDLPADRGAGRRGVAEVLRRTTMETTSATNYLRHLDDPTYSPGKLQRPCLWSPRSLFRRWMVMNWVEYSMSRPARHSAMRRRIQLRWRNSRSSLLRICDISC